jgi:hypothetical protein
MADVLELAPPMFVGTFVENPSSDGSCWVVRFKVESLASV